MRPLLLLLSLSLVASASGPRPPKRAPGFSQTHRSEPGAIDREYPNWATDLGPLPGEVTGLLLPADSRWGRSLEGIGPAVVASPEAYNFGGQAQRRTYELYAANVSPRVVYFQSEPDQGVEFRPDQASITPDGGVKAFPAALVGPGMKNAWGLGQQAHLAQLEINRGEGQARWPRFELIATGVQLLDGDPGYPADVSAVLDSARAGFDQFVAAQRPAVARLLKVASSKADRAAAKAPDSPSEGLFTYWDDSTKRLTVTFFRRVMRTATVSVPCMRIFSGMPSVQDAQAFKVGSGVELGQTMVFDGTGALVSLTTFDPVPIALPAVRPPAEERALEPCPGSYVMPPESGGPAPGLPREPPPGVEPQPPSPPVLPPAPPGALRR